ncbi:MAG: InlB B-repeat-containing protein [Clostridia bacterium]|nr:InlB B-repeat-containing protein [Clostridia bacterium]
MTASQGDESVTVYFRVGSEADISASETENWLTVSGNELYVGGVAVTAENAADITGDGITSGTAYFKVEDSVPTLYLDGVTIIGGYKEEDFLGGSIDWMYRIYGIYCKSASKDKLKIKISGENVIKSEKYTDDKHQTAWIYGIIADNDCAELMLEGSDDSSLKVASEENALAIYSNDWKSCVISINGGKYEFKTDKGDDNGGEAIFCRGSLKIENSEINISTKRNRGIWINIIDDNYATGNEVTSIKNSNITVNSGNGTESWDGIFSAPEIVIENSIANIVCDGRGITACDGESITISGSETEISVKSVGPVKKYWERDSASILTEKPHDSYEGGGEPAEITLNDGLAVTTPDAGSIKAYDFSGNDRFYDYRTAVDQYGVFARDIVIKAPTVHCVCGTSDCTSHTESIVHVADNSLNLVPDIADGSTLTSGSYYLSDDLILTDEKKLNVSGNANICLNGHNLEANIIPGSGAVLNICDCSGGGTITNSGGHVIAFRNNGATVNIYSGTLKTDYEANTIIDFEGYTGNTLNLYGGTVEYEYNDVCTAIGSRTLTVNLYGGKVTSTSANGIVVLSGKINLCGNTEITAPNGYDSIKAYGKELIDAKGYTGGNIRILCSGFSDGDVVVKNVTDETAGKFTLSSKNSGYILKRDGGNLKYTAVYNVSFDSAGGSGTMASIGGVSGEYELPECAFAAPDRKIFKAWSIDGTEYAPGDVIRISKNITVTAIWADIEKTIVTVDESVQTLGYDSRAKSFAVSANVTGGFDVKYRKDGSDIASPTDTGAYDVIITRAEDDTYKAYSKTITGGLVITPKDITGASVGDFEKMTYNGKEQIPVAPVTADGLIATGEWSKVTNVADKTTFTANGNFTSTITDRPTGMEKAQQPSPETPAAVGETIKGKSDGKITGVDSTMEYKADGAVEYTDVAGNEIINLTAGKYLVRYKEKENHLAGSDKTVEISVGEMITVSFDSNGGTDVESKTCEYNQTITSPETEPIKDGFEFIGWFADGELTTEWNFETDKLTGNKTLYAKWVHGVVSDDDGNVENVKADGINEVAKSEKTDIELVVKTVDAANEDSEQTAIRSIENAPNNFVFYDITLKKLSGGNITLASSVIEIKMPYDFSGKRNIKVYRYHDGNVREFTALPERDTVKPFDNGTFFADTQNGCIYIYSSEFSTYSVAYDIISSGSSGGSSVRYTVKFETNGAETVNTQNVIKNSVAKEPAEPKKDGYIFDGWYLSNDFAEKYDFKSKVTKNLTLYAKWTEDKTSAEGKDDNNTSGDNDGKDTPTGNDKHDCPSMNFNDLDINLWYHLDTDYVLSNGLMNGTDTKIFAPNKNLTRAMLVAVLYRNEGEPAVDEPSPFIDVEENAYFGNAVSWAHKNGIVKGISETAFAPYINITREQIAAMIYRYAQFKGIDVSNAASADITAYGDFASISDYASESVRWAVGSGLINGRDESSLSPKENATRAEFATILHRFIEGNK